jgi:hypothetical protein
MLKAAIEQPGIEIPGDDVVVADDTYTMPIARLV